MALARGLQGLAIRIAKRLNLHLGRKGGIFRDRYHGQIIRTPARVGGRPPPGSTWLNRSGMRIR